MVITAERHWRRKNAKLAAEHWPFWCFGRRRAKARLEDRRNGNLHNGIGAGEECEDEKMAEIYAGSVDLWARKARAAAAGR